MSYISTYRITHHVPITAIIFHSFAANHATDTREHKTEPKWSSENSFRKLFSHPLSGLLQLIPQERNISERNNDGLQKWISRTGLVSILLRRCITISDFRIGDETTMAEFQARFSEMLFSWYKICRVFGKFERGRGSQEKDIILICKTIFVKGASFIISDFVKGPFKKGPGAQKFIFYLYF